jgi:hypothetical protein
MKKKMLTILITATLTMLSWSCKTVKSSELKTTKASGLEIDATLYEYKETNTVSVGAQMQTLLSQIGLDFDQGETLTAQWDEENVISSKIYLSNSAFLNLDRDYEGTISKTIPEGNYYLTYKDSDDVETTAQFATGTVSDLTFPTEGETLSGDVVTLTWDPGAMQITDGLSVYTSWHEGSAFAVCRRSIANTGSYQLDISEATGTAAIELTNTKVYRQMEGFGGAAIAMNNVSLRNVTINSNNSNVGSKAASSGLMQDLTSGETIEAMLHKCLRYCEENEERYFIVENEKYSCCL